MKRVLMTALALLAFAAPAAAIDFTVTGANLTVTYTEPTQNACGAPSATCPALTDLDHTNVYLQIGVAAPSKLPNVAATSATGGGAVSTSVTVPIAAGQEANVTIQATATDGSGNESVKSTSATKRVDRLSPGSPN
jgi:hypothetical protein